MTNGNGDIFFLSLNQGRSLLLEEIIKLTFISIFVNIFLEAEWSTNRFAQYCKPHKQCISSKICMHDEDMWIWTLEHLFWSTCLKSFAGIGSYVPGKGRPRSVLSSWMVVLLRSVSTTRARRNSRRPASEACLSTTSLIPAGQEKKCKHGQELFLTIGGKTTFGNSADCHY